jgi:hypothetical protein
VGQKDNSGEDPRVGDDAYDCVMAVPIERRRAKPNAHIHGRMRGCKRLATETCLLFATCPQTGKSGHTPETIGCLERSVSQYFVRLAPSSETNSGNARSTALSNRCSRDRHLN